MRSIVIAVPPILHNKWVEVLNNGKARGAEAVTDTGIAASAE